MIDHLDHLVLTTARPQACIDFYTRVLGFRVSDWIEDFFAFLRCGVDHHTVNFVYDAKPQLHHIAFEVRDWSELHRSSEHFAKNGLNLVWGPLRHIIGHNIAAYHRNPDDQRVELFDDRGPLDAVADLQALAPVDRRVEVLLAHRVGAARPL